MYQYPLNPLRYFDSLGLISIMDVIPGAEIVPFYILNEVEQDMKSLNLVGTDNFFHCTTFCRVSKNPWASDFKALELGGLKESRDYILGRLGLYGDKRKRSHDEMVNDNINDLKVNYYGLTCPSDASCSSHCEKYINPNHLKTKEILREKGYLND